MKTHAFLPAVISYITLVTALVPDMSAIVMSGPDYDTGEIRETTLVMLIDSDGSSDDRLISLGLLLLEDDAAVNADEASFGSPFSSTLGGFDFYGDEPVTSRWRLHRFKRRARRSSCQLLGLGGALNKSRCPMKTMSHLGAGIRKSKLESERITFVCIRPRTPFRFTGLRRGRRGSLQ